MCMCVCVCPSVMFMFDYTREHTFAYPCECIVNIHIRILYIRTLNNQQCAHMCMSIIAVHICSICVSLRTILLIVFFSEC